MSVIHGDIAHTTFAAALTVIAAASCQKEQPETKVTLGDKVDNRYPVLWQEGDQLMVTHFL